MVEVEYRTLTWSAWSMDEKVHKSQELAKSYCQGVADRVKEECGSSEEIQVVKGFDHLTSWYLEGTCIAKCFPMWPELPER